ncbi:MAG: VanZ family protein [Bacteroidetes bacterium]|nr:VanZ family protein [Bacteroidota bacterium]
MPKLCLKKIQPSFFPGAAWLVTTTILLIVPGSAFPKADWLSKVWFDKWVHIFLFAVLVFLWCWSLLRYRFDEKRLKNLFVVCSLTGFAYGVGMEFVQKHFVANRFFDSGDIAADAAGCVAGLIFSLRRFIKK